MDRIGSPSGQAPARDDLITLVCAWHREIERKLRYSRFRGVRRPGFIDFPPRQCMQIKSQSCLGEAALNSLLGEMWPVVGLGEMGQPDGRRPGRSPDRLRKQLSAASVREVTRVRENSALKALGIGTPAKHRLVMVRL